MVRTRPAKRILRLSTSAISRPATIASATDSSVNRTVTQSDFLNFRSSITSEKFSAPTKVAL